MLRIKRGLLAAVAAAALLNACGEDPVDSASDKKSLSDDDDDDDNKASDDDDDDDAPKKDAGKGGTKDAGAKDSGKAPSTSGGGDTGADAKGGGVPCNVATILSANCASCHGTVPSGTATFSLATIADFQKTGKDKRAYHAIAFDRVTQANGAKRMPPTSLPKLADADLKTLSDWLKGGAKAGEDSCEVKTPAEKPEVVAGEGKPVGSTPGGLSTEPIAYEDQDELFCQKFVAFNSASDQTKPYNVPNRPDLYMGFRIHPKWKGVQYARSFRVITDNKDAIHHWLFFADMSKGAEGISSQSGAHPDGILQHGWAPGGDSLYFEPDYGIELSGDVSYLLESHYNNTGSGPVPDASGVEVCVSPKKPKNLAAVSWVGTDAIAGTSATGTCTPKGAVTIMAGSPHMHKKGKHMKVTWNKKGGEKKVIFDEDFSFEDQRQYLLDGIVLEAGDTLTTTCDYTSASTFGTSTSAEMCYFFSIATPPNTLVSTGDIISNVIHGPNTCLN